jgi:hypothetical protein
VPRLNFGEVVSQDPVDDVHGESGVLRVGFKGTDKNLHGFPDCPAASSDPGGRIHGQPFPEDTTARARQERLGNRRVACGVAHAAGAEIEDGAEPAVIKQQVAGLRVAVEPHCAAIPGGIERGLPDLGGEPGINVTLKGLERVSPS